MVRDLNLPLSGGYLVNPKLKIGYPSIYREEDYFSFSLFNREIQTFTMGICLVNVTKRAT